MLTYRHTDTLEVVSFSDFNYANCVGNKWLKELFHGKVSHRHLQLLLLQR